MRAYLIRRLLLIIPTLLLVSIIVFGFIRFIPGDIIDLMVSQMNLEGEMGASETSEGIRKALGLDVPVHIQYVDWLGGVFRGDLGTSLWKNQPVTTMILSRIPVTLELAALAVITAILIALPIGVYSAIRQDTGGDYAGRTFAILCISVPNFWIGTMIMVYPSIYFQWSPPMEYVPLIKDVGGNLLQFIIPGFIMGMVMSGTTMRMTRTMMLEVLRQDYIRTAWSKGLSERTVILRHAVKNAMIPVVSMIGLLFTYVIAGSVVIEQIFNLPGMGRLMIESLNKRDYPVISGINLILAGGVLLINLGIDLTYGYLDPRVQYR